jgi:replicative DNA helicase
VTKQQIPCTDVDSEALYLRSCIGVVTRPQHEHMQDPEQRLDPADFHFEAHSRLAALLWSRADAKQAVWKHELKKAAPELAEALDRVLVDPGEREQPPSAIAEHLRALARRRRKYEALLRAAASLVAGDEESADEHALSVASEQTEQRAGEYLASHEVVWAAVEEDRRARTESGHRRTGFVLLDRAVGSLRPKTLTVIGGTTGAGKSSLVLASAVNQARRGLHVGIVSCEDAETVWGERLYAHVEDAAISGASDEQADRASRAAAALPIHFAFELGRPLKDVLRAVRHLVRKHRCQVIYVDYLQAIGDPQSKERRHFVAGAAAKLKAQCQELGATLVLASQLSRPSKEKPFGEVFTSDLKESGDVENMAEVVLLLWKNGDRNDSLTLGKVAKIKWSAARPRFQVQRSAAGAITGVLRANQIPAAEREKRCSKCWRGLSRCECPDAPPTVAELLREIP